MIACWPISRHCCRAGLCRAGQLARTTRSQRAVYPCWREPDRQPWLSIHALSLNADIEGYLDESRRRPLTYSTCATSSPRKPPPPAGANCCHLRPHQLYGCRHRLLRPGGHDLILYAAGVVVRAPRLVHTGLWKPAAPADRLWPAPRARDTCTERRARDTARPRPGQQEPCADRDEAVAGNTTGPVRAGRASADAQATSTWLRRRWTATGRDAHAAPALLGAVGPGSHQRADYEPAGYAMVLVAGWDAPLAAAAEWRGKVGAKATIEPTHALWIALKPFVAPLAGRVRFIRFALPPLLLSAAGLPTLQLSRCGHDAFEYCRDGRVLPRLAEAVLPAGARLSSGYGQPSSVQSAGIYYYLAFPAGLPDRRLVNCRLRCCVAGSACMV